MRFGWVTSSFERTNPPASKWFVAPGPRRRKSHWKPIHGLRRCCSARLHRDGLRAGVLDVDLEVVLEVPADAGQLVPRLDADCAEVLRRADARELEQLRRVDRAAAEDHLARLDDLPARAARDLDADRARAVEHDPRRGRAAAHLEVRAVRAPGGGTHGPRRAGVRAGCSGRTSRSPPAGSR